jgi:hypothetical protein
MIGPKVELVTYLRAYSEFFNKTPDLIFTAPTKIRRELLECERRFFLCLSGHLCFSRSNWCSSLNPLQYVQSTCGLPPSRFTLYEAKSSCALSALERRYIKFSTLTNEIWFGSGPEHWRGLPQRNVLGRLGLLLFGDAPYSADISHGFNLSSSICHDYAW